jgi:hypothetical protein
LSQTPPLGQVVHNYSGGSRMPHLFICCHSLLPASFLTLILSCQVNLQCTDEEAGTVHGSCSTLPPTELWSATHESIRVVKIKTQYLQRNRTTEYFFSYWEECKLLQPLCKINFAFPGDFEYVNTYNLAIPGEFVL